MSRTRSVNFFPVFILIMREQWAIETEKCFAAFAKAYPVSGGMMAVI
jgi:hypothetical protein